MASRSSILLLLAVAVLVAAPLGTAAARSPGYCVPGQAIPRSPLPHCRWYVASRTCGGAVPLLPLRYMKAMCCRQLEFIPAECRCKALRVMMEEDAARLSTSAAAELEQQMCCWRAQGDFAAAVVAEAECGLRTIHGRPFCYALGAEE